MKLCFLMTALGASLSLAQPLSIGVKGGVPLVDFVETLQSPNAVSHSDMRRYLIGPTAEIRLPLGLSLEVDALYRNVGYDYRLTGVDTVTQIRTHANSWQFPILVKWTFLPGAVRPFVDGGINLQRVSGIHEIGTFTVVPSRVTYSASDRSRDLLNDFTAGASFGGGLQIRLGRIRLEPEIRYTRWGSATFRDPARAVLSSNLNQADLLLGIRF